MNHSTVLALGQAAETENLAFWVLAVMSVAAALGMVLARRAVHCAVLLAVVMLFLFVLMIVGVSSRDSLVETIRGQRLAAGLVGTGLLILLALIIGHAAIGPAAPPSAANSASNLPGIATLIFTTYVFPFEVTSALLITAALGAMVLAHRERTKPKPTQRELARLRVASGRPAPLPGPGVYALHDAVDMPALLPDGTPSNLSVSPVILQRELVADESRGGPPARAGELEAGTGENTEQPEGARW